MSGTDKGQLDANLPSGRDLLARIFAAQDATEVLTDKELQRAGERAPACFAEIGTVLGYLDRMASCSWGCRQGDHLIEYLCGRAASQTLASLRLMRFGLYDEALLACRGIGEIANLLFLFHHDPSSFREWADSSEQARRKAFSPVNVRKRLEASGSIIPIDEQRYSRLSGIAAHVNPATRPQAHNLLGVPGTGLGFQEAGALACLNETAGALASVTAGGSFLLGYDAGLRKEILGACRALVQQIGAIDLAGAEAHRATASASPELKSLLEDVRRQLIEASKKRGQRAEPPATSGTHVGAEAGHGRSAQAAAGTLSLDDA
jgi:hypothetical protein